MRHRFDDEYPQQSLCGKMQSDPDVQYPEGELVWYDLSSLDQNACRACYHAQEQKKVQSLVEDLDKRFEALRGDPELPLYWQDKMGQQAEEISDLRADKANAEIRHEQETKELRESVQKLEEDVRTLTVAVGILTSGGNREKLRRIHAIHSQRIHVDPEILTGDPLLKPHLDFHVDTPYEPSIEPELRTAWDRVCEDD